MVAHLRQDEEAEAERLGATGGLGTRGRSCIENPLGAFVVKTALFFFSFFWLSSATISAQLLVPFASSLYGQGTHRLAANAPHARPYTDGTGGFGLGPLGYYLFPPYSPSISGYNVAGGVRWDAIGNHVIRAWAPSTSTSAFLLVTSTPRPANNHMTFGGTAALWINPSRTDTVAFEMGPLVNAGSSFVPTEVRLSRLPGALIGQTLYFQVLWYVPLAFFAGTGYGASRCIEMSFVDWQAPCPSGTSAAYGGGGGRPFLCY